MTYIFRMAVTAPGWAAPISQSHDAIAAIDVDRLAGDAAGEVAEQVEGGGAEVLGLDVAAQRRFLRGVLAQVVEAGDARRSSGCASARR